MKIFYNIFFQRKRRKHEENFCRLSFSQFSMLTAGGLFYWRGNGASFDWRCQAVFSASRPDGGELLGW
jgi:hypothetical protein